MDDVLLLLHDLMKLALIAGVIVLVATTPSRAGTEGHGLLTSAAQTTTHDQDDKPSWGRRMLLADDDLWSDSEDTTSSFNVDGTPMAGDIDLNGNLYGCCSSGLDSWDGSTSSMWD
jgi:hypothetical protein